MSRAVLLALPVLVAGCASAPGPALDPVAADAGLAPVCCGFGAPSAAELLPILVLFAPIVIPILVIGLPIWLIERVAKR